MDPAAFNAFEAQGWERIGAGYETFIGRVTRRTTVPLLDAAQVRAGSRVLDVATGPGHVAAEAAGRGATVTGVDVASSMVELARHTYPGLAFEHGDAEALPFAAGSFDSVVANFVLLHLGQPERAAAEAARVLRSGGYVAMTTWDVPQHCRLLGVLVEAMAQAGAVTPADLPSGPPFFRFADKDTACGLLTDAGFGSVQVSTVAFDQPIADAEELWQGMINGTVRNGAVLNAQPAETLQRIRAAFDRNLAAYQRGDHLQVPVSVKLVSGRKP
ncbi:methyltransferase [Rhizocola hellebori]|uniref:Methyltransferase n=1 Tax=Rhizocola hellebori TaxID=1392758 RepID=A0A8J3QAK8_9ACTN|nr:class I SAM-dependent methyltransferase [Rhizocola hellebori]GIH06332.1 methyltransferase [Rhizocola hellebori]